MVGVAGLVLHAGRVLLIRRGRPPMAGAWSLPGGALRTGERMIDGVVREVFEETAMYVVPIRQIATLDRIVYDEAGRVQFHYVLIDWLCHLAFGQSTPAAGSDASDAAWVTLADLPRMAGLDQIAIDLIHQAMVGEGQA